MVNSKPVTHSNPCTDSTLSLEHPVDRKLWMAAAGIAAALSFTPVMADEPVDTSGSRDISIPFANHGGIRDWQADRDRGLWIQDAHNKWYYATVMTPCLGLNFANSIGFDTRPQGNFDRFSVIVVPGEGRCMIQTLRQSGAPPSKHHKTLNVIDPQTSSDTPPPRRDKLPEKH